MTIREVWTYQERWRDERYSTNIVRKKSERTEIVRSSVAYLYDTVVRGTGEGGKSLRTRESPWALLRPRMIALSLSHR